MTIFATEDSMNTIKDNSNFAYKSDVTSSHWTAHLKHSHQAEIKIQVQCEAMAVIEYWHYTVFDPDEKLCYFGIISMNSFKKPGEEEVLTEAGSSTSEAPPMTEGELSPLVVDDTATRQIQINTAELGFFMVDFFTERASVIVIGAEGANYTIPQDLTLLKFSEETSADISKIIKNWR